MAVDDLLGCIIISMKEVFHAPEKRVHSWFSLYDRKHQKLKGQIELKLTLTLFLEGETALKRMFSATPQIIAEQQLRSLSFPSNMDMRK